VPLNSPIRGLYAITPDGLDTDRLLHSVASAIAGGAATIQYRNKAAEPAQRLDQCRRLQSMCSVAQVRFIVNDDWRLALETDADGVHIGREDGDPRVVRAAIGADRILGVSCYDDFESARAVAGVADYVAFGSVFPSPTKAAAIRAPLSLFRRGRERGWNCVAIGGIGIDNVALVRDAGADAIAVISAIFDAPDIAAASSALAHRFERPLTPKVSD